MSRCSKSRYLHCRPSTLLERMSKLPPRLMQAINRLRVGLRGLSGAMRGLCVGHVAHIPAPVSSAIQVHITDLQAFARRASLSGGTAPRRHPRVSVPSAEAPASVERGSDPKIRLSRVARKSFEQQACGPSTGGRIGELLANAGACAWPTMGHRWAIFGPQQQKVR